MFKNFYDTRILGKQVIYLPKCHSTNDIAADMIRNGNAREGSIVITDYQTGGRGQRGRSWSSREGSNLLFSLILYPEFLESGGVFMLNMAISMGIIDALSTFTAALKIRWPNDIYYNDLKLGGILIENNIRGTRVINSVAGIGLNINQDDFEVEKAVSLYQILNAGQDRSEIFKMVISGIDERYYNLKEGRKDQLKKDYLNVLYRFGENSLFRAGDEFFGRISGVDDSGRLLLLIDGRMRHFSLGEIQYAG